MQNSPQQPTSSPSPSPPPLAAAVSQHPPIPPTTTITLSPATTQPLPHVNSHASVSTDHTTSSSHTDADHIDDSTEHSSALVSSNDSTRPNTPLQSPQLQPTVNAAYTAQAAADLQHLSTTPLRGLFLCEFDITAGPRLSYQYPPIPTSNSNNSQQQPNSAALTEDEFDACSDYLIVSPEICHTIITVCTLADRTLLAYPVHLQSSKYPRNSLFFTVGMILNANAATASSHNMNSIGKRVTSSASTYSTKSTSSTPAGHRHSLRSRRMIAMYEPALRQLATAIIQLEVNKSYLTAEGGKQRVGNVLKQVYQQLSRSNHCSVTLDDEQHTILTLNVVPPVPQPPAVQLWDVPIVRVDISTYLKQHQQADRNPYAQVLRQLNDADLLTGEYTVKQLAQRCGSDIRAVIDAIYYGMEHHMLSIMLSIVDIHHSTNVYVATPQLHLLLTHAGLQQQCLQYVSERPAIDSKDYSTVTATINDVIQLYCKLNRNTTVKTLQKYVRSQHLDVDVRRLIVFGLVYNLIRRVHCYPVSIKQSLDDTRSTNGDGLPSFLTDCDGTLSVDVLSCMHEVAADEIYKLVATHRSQVLPIWR